MNPSRTNIVLGLMLAAVVLLAAAAQVDHSRPNYELLPAMKRSPASDAYAANDVFANGRTLQTPVAGVIARGELPLHYAATPEDAQRAGDELQNPFNHADAQWLEASVERGARVYAVFCIACHGPSGAGDGPVAQRGFPPPPPLPTGKSAQMKDGQLFHILTYGQGSMAPMAAQLTRDRRWDVVNFVRSLQISADAPPAAETTKNSTVAPSVAIGESKEANSAPQSAGETP